MCDIFLLFYLQDTDVNVMVSMLQEANLILWSFVLMLMTLNELMSSYIPLLCILWPAFFYTALNMLGFKHTGQCTSFFIFLAGYCKYIVLISVELWRWLLILTWETINSVPTSLKNIPDN